MFAAVSPVCVIEQELRKYLSIERMNELYLCIIYKTIYKCHDQKVALRRVQKKFLFNGTSGGSRACREVIMSHEIGERA